MMKTKTLPGILFFMLGSTLLANGEPTAADAMFTVNNTWMLVSTFLVFIMHLGFATLESGLTQAKNTVNILFKNVSIIAIGILTYTLCGFNLMYPGDFNGYLGFSGFGISAPAGVAGLIEYANGAYTYFTDFIFQAMFAATAATIVSGAVAERIKLSSFLIFSTIYVALVYPIVGSWTWGAGWLADKNFHDFAGSTLVHSVGGWAALIGAYTLGPRLGKYGKNGNIKPILGHNMPLAAIGVFCLWFGWYGFNGGSVLSADPGPLGLVFTTTSLAAAAGAIAAMLVSWVVSQKPDLSMGLNGMLAGLVGITANADIVSAKGAIVIGLIAGVIVVISVIAFDKAGIDDPVGAISVHGVCGVWGLLACALFDTTEGGFTIGGQLVGVLAVGGAAFVFSLVVFGIIKAVMGIRVTDEEEDRGLDIAEHGQEAYPDFSTSSSN